MENLIATLASLPNDQRTTLMDTQRSMFDLTRRMSKEQRETFMMQMTSGNKFRPPYNDRASFIENVHRPDFPFKFDKFEVKYTKELGLYLRATVDIPENTLLFDELPTAFAINRKLVDRYCETCALPINTGSCLPCRSNMELSYHNNNMRAMLNHYYANRASSIEMARIGLEASLVKTFEG